MRCRVKLPSEKDPRFKSWAKTVDFVDIEHDNGYAFEGEWLRRGHTHDLQRGAIVLLYDETGSRQKQVSNAEIHRVEEHGLVGPIFSASGTDWVLQIRDDVAELLMQELPPPDLSDVETHILALELLSRISIPDDVTEKASYNFRSGAFGVAICQTSDHVYICSLSEQQLAEQKLQDAARVAGIAKPAKKKPAPKTKPASPVGPTGSTTSHARKSATSNKSSGSSGSTNSGVGVPEDEF